MTYRSVTDWCKGILCQVLKKENLYLGLLLLGYGFFLLHRIDISVGDLGRHLKNGELIIQYISEHRSLAPILHTNFYSHTFGDTSFVNHHWGSGVLFFSIWKLFGFSSLIIGNACIGLIALVLFWRAIRPEARGMGAFIIGCGSLMLLSERVDIRPEMFSYLGVALFFYILEKQRQGILSERYLYALPLIELVWVNLHIYFFLGPFLLGLYFLESVIPKPRVERSTKVLGACLVATVIFGCVNPSGVAGFLYPLCILGDYGLSIQENLSLHTLLLSNPWYGPGTIFKIIVFFFIVGFGVLFFKQRTRFRLLRVVIIGIFAVFAIHMARNISLFGFLALPIGAELWYSLRPILFKQKRIPLYLGITIIGFFLLLFGLLSKEIITRSWHSFGVTLEASTADAALFMRDQKIAGPLFNDFDSGSYLIWYLYPAVKPFVDNRPEAYGAVFFSDQYIPMNQDEAAWQAADKNFNFNSIVYSFSDRAPWTFPFIIARINDPVWAPVFANQYAIIFVKRTDANEALIKKYEVPKSAFSVVEG